MKSYMLEGKNYTMVMDLGRTTQLYCYGEKVAEIEKREIRVATPIKSKANLTAVCIFIEKKTGVNGLSKARLERGGEYGGYIITRLK